MPPWEEHVRRFLGESGPFRELPSARLDELSRRCTVRTLSAGSFLHFRLDETRGVHGLRTGFLKAFAYSEEGRGFLADIVCPGDWFGFAPLLLGSRRHFDLRAETESTLVGIDASVLETVLSRHPEVYRHIALVIAERFELALDQLRANSLLDVERGLAFRLSRLFAAHGRPDPGGGLVLPFRLSQEELGQLIGATREAVGRCLRGWEADGWIDLGYAQLVIRKPEVLAALVAADGGRKDGGGSSSKRS